MSAATSDSRSVSVRDLVSKKGGERLVMVSAYDALFGRLADEAKVDAVLVGDSLGNVIAGLDSTVGVTLDHMIYHTAAVRRGVKRALVVADMPFLTYQVSVEQALTNCGRLIQESGAQAVKLEGGGEEVLRAVTALVRIGIPVMGHLGFTPQSVNAMGVRVQGRNDADANRLMEEARRLQDAGAFSVVLELVPAALAREVTSALAIPTIGIGAGPGCDGQVLVLHDLLGLTDGFNPKFLRRYASLADDVRDAVSRYRDDVRGGHYPDDDHSF